MGKLKENLSAKLTDDQIVDLYWDRDEKAITEIDWHQDQTQSVQAAGISFCCYQVKHNSKPGKRLGVVFIIWTVSPACPRYICTLLYPSVSPSRVADRTMSWS